MYSGNYIGTHRLLLSKLHLFFKKRYIIQRINFVYFYIPYLNKCIATHKISYRLQRLSIYVINWLGDWVNIMKDYYLLAE